MTDPALHQLVAAAVTRHRGLADALRAIADDLPPSRRRLWQQMAGLLTSGETAAACRAARRHPAAWLPLLTCHDTDTCLDRLVVVATAPQHMPATRWGGTLYALVISTGSLIMLGLLTRSVLPIFDEMLVSFGVELPAVTQLILRFGRFIGNGGLLVVLLMAAAGMAVIAIRRRGGRSGRRELVATALEQLMAAGISSQEALPIAATLAGIAAPSTTSRLSAHRYQLSPAIAAACSAAPTAAPALLGAVAANYADRSRHQRQTIEWLLGPVAVVLMGFAVGFTTLVLFLPLVRLVGVLS